MAAPAAPAGGSPTAAGNGGGVPAAAGRPRNVQFADPADPAAAAAPSPQPPQKPPQGPVHCSNAGLVRVLTELQKNPAKVRAFCMLAHVDHGKTTLSDHLISTNDVISSSMAGKARYLDCRPDEVEKLITMKASTISLYHRHNSEPYLLNLIDSPGHVDFSCEVSTAVRLSDGALVVIDAVDGVCSQTRSVLSQAYRERVRCCVVINKFDLLVTKVHLSPEDAYDHLARILQEVNAMFEAYAQADAIASGDLFGPRAEAGGDDGVDDDDDEDPWFSPAKGNVVFASAHEGWGFTTRQFAAMYASKWKWSEATLARCLWGEWYLKLKEHRISKKRPGRAAQPMCVKFVLAQLWRLYEAAGVIPGDDGVTAEGDARHDRLAKICAAVGSPLARGADAQRLRRLAPADAAAAVLRSWLPLAPAVLDMVVTHLPSPAEAQRYRAARVVPDLPLVRDAALRARAAAGLAACDAAAPLMAFVAKMVDTEYLPGAALQRRGVDVATEKDAGVEDGRDDTAFVAVARVYSGTLRRGQRVRVLEPRHRPGDRCGDAVEVTQLFMLMGRGVEPVGEVPAGNICGIGGLSHCVLKSATLAESGEYPGFEQMLFQSGAVIRQSIEPKSADDLERLRAGLKLLNKADPQVEVVVTEAGEHVLCCAGEVHAQRCVRDLEDRYARIEMRVSEPIVGLRETIVKEQKKPAVVETPDKSCSFSISAHEIPEGVAAAVEKHEEALRRLLRRHGTGGGAGAGDDDDVDGALNAAVDALGDAFREAGRRWAALWEGQRLWALGPKQCGSCALFAAPGAGDLIGHGAWAAASAAERRRRRAGGAASPPPRDEAGDPERRAHSPAHDDDDGGGSDRGSAAGSAAASDDAASCASTARRVVRQLGDSIVAGFELATAHGPMCEEPMSGVAFVVDEVAVAAGADAAALGGFVMSAVARGCRLAFEQEGRRLVEPIYACTITGSGDCHGKVSAVLHRRRGEVVDLIPQEGSDAFIVEAHLPVVESFGLTQELRVQTSGLAQPSLTLSHWRRLDEDPYFVPRTEDEKEDCSKHDVEWMGNVPKRLIKRTRQRKGLPTGEQVVMDPEKMKKYSTSAC